MKKPISILLIDDDDVSLESTERSLRRNGPPVKIHTATNGLEGLAALRGEGPDGPLPKNLIVLLDINMPVMNGFEFLAELRNDPALRSTVVFVLSTSDSVSDRLRAYDSIIAGYMVKSSLGPQLANLTRLVEHYDETVSFP